MEAVLYAFNNGYPIFFAETRRPFRFEHIEGNKEVAFLGLPGWPPKSLTTLGGEKKAGIPKELLWERLLFLLSLDGKVPVSNLCSSLRYDGDRLVCSNDYAKIMECSFGRCYYFGDHKATGFVTQKTLDDPSYLCYDYIAFNQGGKHEIDYIHTGDDFVSEIWFYGSDRIDGNTPVRDACAVSKLTESQLLDFDYSETMARFKVLKIMKDAGMKGKQNGYTEKGAPRHYDFRTTSIGRETHRIRDEGEPQSTNIEIPQVSEKDLLQNLSSVGVAHYRFLR
jgi:hypothetical protein